MKFKPLQQMKVYLNLEGGCALEACETSKNEMIRSFGGPEASLMRIINAAFTAFTALLHFMDFLFWLCYRCDARREYDRWQAQVILTRRVIFPGSPVI